MLKLSIEKHRNGIRYKKMYKGNLFKSSTYPKDTREARNEARHAFESWQQQFITSEDRKQSFVTEAKIDIKDAMKRYDQAKAALEQAQDDATIIMAISGIDDDTKRAEQLDIYRDTKGSERHLKQLIEEFNKTQLRLTELPKDNPRALSKYRQKDKCTHLALALSTLTNIHIDELMESEVNQVFSAIDAKEVAEITKRDYWSTFKEFVKSTIEDGFKQAAPRNLHSKKLRFTPTKKTPKPPSVEDAKYVLDALREANQPLLELAVLLHLNCGMYSSDIADLTKTDVDLDRGLLTYARSKTEKHDFAAVIYPLWTRTKQLLTDLQSEHDTLFLTNRNGTHLTLSNKGVRSDNIGRQFRRKKEDHYPEFNYALLDFRKTAATELRELGYKDCVDQFLQHIGKGNTTDDYYVGHARIRFIEGLTKLEKVFYPKPKIVKVS